MVVVLLWGVFCTIVLIVFPAPIFRIFIPETDILPMGVAYLQILGVSQLFMCMEITTAGAFSGLGRTLPPSVVSITLTTARIPLALLLISTPLGLNGIWWSITISSIFKGLVLTAAFKRWHFGLQRSNITYSGKKTAGAEVNVLPGHHTTSSPAVF